MNDKGTVNITAGVGLGIHGTIYQQTTSLLGIKTTEEEEDGAVTVTVPIDVQFGLFRPLSLGIYVEPGAYLDSNATRSNALLIAGVKPQLYLVQDGDFAWYLNGRAGMNFLNIDYQDEQLDERIEESYSGPHFGVGTGIGTYFGGAFGFNFGLIWMRSSFNLKDLTINNTTQNLEAFEAELETSGVELTAQLAFRF